jgi:hypothetical protein
VPIAVKSPSVKCRRYTSRRTKAERTPTIKVAIRAKAFVAARVVKMRVMREENLIQSGCEALTGHFIPESMQGKKHGASGEVA